MTSYRAELQGQVALILMTMLLAQFFQITEGQLCSFSDSKGALKRLSRNWKTSLSTHKEPEADLLLYHASLRHRSAVKFDFWLASAASVPSQDGLDGASQRTRPGIRVNYTWVKGHRDDKVAQEELTQNEWLNIEMDALAAQAHGFQGEWAPRSNCTILPGEKWGIFHHGVKSHVVSKRPLSRHFKRRIHSGI